MFSESLDGHRPQATASHGFPQPRYLDEAIAWIKESQTDLLLRFMATLDLRCPPTKLNSTRHSIPILRLPRRNSRYMQPLAFQVQVDLEGRKDRLCCTPPHHLIHRAYRSRRSSIQTITQSITPTASISSQQRTIMPNTTRSTLQAARHRLQKVRPTLRLYRVASRVRTRTRLNNPHSLRTALPTCRASHTRHTSNIQVYRHTSRIPLARQVHRTTPSQPSIFTATEPCRQTRPAVFS